MNHGKHAFRAFLILGLMLGTGIVARSALIPSSYGHFGAYRADHLFETHAKEPLIQDIDTCIDCHEKEWDMADGKHGAVPCAGCHVSQSAHAVKGGQAPTDEELAKTEAQATARLTFQSILAVMRQGWDKKRIDQFLAMLNEGGLGIKIRLFRGEAVARQFGQRQGQAEMLNQSPDVKEAMFNGMDKLLMDKDTVRYIYPLVADTQCLECHSASKPGEIHGALEVSFPVSTLALKRYRKLADISIDRSREACQICHAKLDARPKTFPQVDDFDKHIKKGWKEALGPLNLQARCITCHNAHIPSIVKRKES